MDISLSASVPLALTTAIVVLAYYYYKNAFAFWQKRDITGPRPYPFIGNFGQLMFDLKAITRWMLEYGKLYGTYEGTKPVLVVCDPDVMRQICIEDFDFFPNHPDVVFNTELGRNFLFHTNDDHWRRVRAILSPTFTSGKMRRMHKLVDVCAESLVETMHERIKSKPTVNLKDLFGLYTMDAIASCCYGLRLASYKGKARLTSASNQDDFVKLAMRLFDPEIWRILVIMCVHESILERIGFTFMAASTEWDFARRVQQIIKQRCESGKHFDDYLQTLIDAQLDSDGLTNDSELHEDDNNVDPELHHTGVVGDGINGSVQKADWQHYKDKPLSEIEVLSGATFLLVVGLETTSTLLSFCVYALSFHEEIQEKLYQTIKSLVNYDDQNKAKFDYDSLTSCQYLDAVISETLRIHPPVIFTDRCTKQDYYLENQKLHIPKGTKILLALKAIMADPDNWLEPDVFNPERFMPENRHKIKPYSYCPFGIGPRQCLGMRFSLFESKLALAKLLLEFKFDPAPGTKYPPEPKIHFGLNHMKRPEVIVSKR